MAAVTAAGPGSRLRPGLLLTYMLDAFPLSKMLKLVFTGSAMRGSELAVSRPVDAGLDVDLLCPAQCRRVVGRLAQTSLGPPVLRRNCGEAL